MPLVASVLLPLPLPEAFDYAAGEALGLAVGDHVSVPLGSRAVRGVVVAIRDGAGVNRPLKPVLARLEDAPLPAGVLAFVDWAARYACEPAGEALALALRGLRAKPAPGAGRPCSAPYRTIATRTEAGRPPTGAA